MSKVIIKIGPETKKIEQSEFKIIELNKTPKVTFKYANDRSVVFFDRNPFYCIITEYEHVQEIITLLEILDDETKDEHSKKVARGQVLSYTEFLLSSWISQNMFTSFSESLINALKNSKSVGMRIAKQDK